MNEQFSATNVAFGQKLRARRLEIGMTQQGLASKSGISFQQIQKYENGTNAMSAARMQQICRILGVPETYFYHGGYSSTRTTALKAGEKKSVWQAPPAVQGAARKLLGMFEQIDNPADRKSFLAVAEALAQKMSQKNTKKTTRKSTAKTTKSKK